MSWHLECSENSEAMKQPAVYSDIRRLHTYHETIFFEMLSALFRIAIQHFVKFQHENANI
jgi:hypothetical protein